jgi:hypothetical protein
VSEIFEGILCAVEPRDLEAIVARLVSAGSPNARRLRIRVRELGPQLSAAFVTNPRAQGSYLAQVADVASELSRLLGKALLVAYDTRVGVRLSALFSEGDAEAEYGEEDELFVPLREDGTPDAGGRRFHPEELDPSGEYETILNAVQMGLQQFGHPEAWAALRDLISAQRA